MVLSPASTYRMLHALCVASKDKTQKELRSLVSCKPRDTKKISANIRKIGKKRIRVSNCLPDICGYPGFLVGKLIVHGFKTVLTGFKGIPQLYSSLGRLDLQTGLRILTSYASSSEILGLNLRVENKNFDMDWIGALDRINKVKIGFHCFSLAFIDFHTIKFISSVFQYRSRENEDCRHAKHGPR